MEHFYYLLSVVVPLLGLGEVFARKVGPESLI